jgi:hypothetical protein
VTMLTDPGLEAFAARATGPPVTIIDRRRLQALWRTVAQRREGVVIMTKAVAQACVISIQRRPEQRDAFRPPPRFDPPRADEPGSACPVADPPSLDRPEGAPHRPLCVIFRFPSGTGALGRGSAGRVGGRNAQCSTRNAPVFVLGINPDLPRPEAPRPGRRDTMRPAESAGGGNGADRHAPAWLPASVV